MIFLILVFIQTSFAQIERLNFFPESKSFLTIESKYTNDNTYAKIPSEEQKTKRQYGTALKASFDYRFFDNTFIGLSIDYGEGEEVGARYGDSGLREYENQGFGDLEIHSRTRLRQQENDQGSLDLLISLSSGLETAEVGTAEANRKMGYTNLNVGFAHGYQEDRWEFRSTMALNQAFEGEEKNLRSGQTFTLRAHRDLSFSFHAQYEFKPTWYVVPGIGIVYRGAQRLDDGNNDTRKIQAGTGSMFDLGLKKVLRATDALTLNLHHSRNEYFIEGDPSNFDGYERFYALALTWIKTI
jgi:hypothetical protein